jgi:hypothetical protein
MSSLPADETLTPRPLDLSRATSVNPADYPPNDVADNTSSKVYDRPSTEADTLPHPPRPRSIDQSHASSDSESEALVKEIVRYPMVEASATHTLTQIPSQSRHFLVNQKAAKVLGLDGAGCVSLIFRVVGSC